MTITLTAAVIPGRLPTLPAPRNTRYRRYIDVLNPHPSGVYNEGSFKIKTLFTITVPSAASKWLVNSLQDIAWLRTGTVSEVKLEYATSADNYAVWTEITPSASSADNNYTWTVADCVSVSGDPNDDEQRYNPYALVKVRISDVSAGHPRQQ